eukprot:m51a1_g10895 hypothetical protein (868) ;mRNA; f:19729-22920
MSGLRSTYRVRSRLETVYTGGTIRASPDDGALLACTRDQDVCIVDAATFRTICTLPGDESDVTGFAFRPGTREFVSAGTNHQIRQWTLPEAAGADDDDDDAEQKPAAAAPAAAAPLEPFKSWRLPSAFAVSMEFDASGTLLAMGCTDARIRVWEYERGYYTHSFRAPSAGVVSVVSWHPSPRRCLLAAAGEDGAVRLCDLTQKSSRDLRSHMSRVTALVWSADGARLVSCARDNVAAVWDTASGELLLTIPTYESIEGMLLMKRSQLDGLVGAGKRRADGDESLVMVGAGETSTVRVWDVATGALMWSQPQPANASYTHLIHSAANRTILAVTAVQDIAVHSAEDLSRIGFVVGNRDQVADMQYVGPDSLLIVNNSERPQLYNTDNATTRMLEGHSDVVLCCAVSKDAKWIATGSLDSTVRVWRASDLRCVRVCKGHTEAVGAVAFGAKSASLLVSVSKDTTLKSWAVPETSGVKTEESDSDSEEGGDDDEKETATAKITARAHAKDINGLAVAPNDKIIATASQDKTAKIWNAKDLTLLGTLEGHRRGVWAVQFSPVDQVVATASSDTTIKIWSATNYSCLKTFEGHSGAVLRVSFVTRGMQLLSTAADGLIKLWTIKTNDCADTMDAHTDKIWALAVKDDGEEFATGGCDSIINTWGDCTTVVEEEKRAEADEKILKEQRLANLLHENRFQKALEIAFSLKHPRTVLKIIEKVIETQNEESAEAEGAEDAKMEMRLGDVVAALSDEHLCQLVGYAADWNTNIRHCAVAQAVFFEVFKNFSFAKLKAAIPTLKQMLEAIIPYTERHFKHADRMMQRTWLMSYTRSAMVRGALPEEPVAEVKAEEQASSDDEDEEGDSNSGPTLMDE